MAAIRVIYGKYARIDSTYAEIHIFQRILKADFLYIPPAHREVPTITATPRREVLTIALTPHAQR